MTTAPENPPAFPSANDVELMTASGLVGTKGHAGMSLRDYLAGQALAGITASLEGTDQFRTLSIGAANRKVPFAQHVADLSYEMADAMLSARAQPKPTP